MSRVLECLPLLILTALLFVQQPTFSPTPGTPGFSFEKVLLPSLADINAGKFKKQVQGNSFQLTNVDTFVCFYRAQETTAKAAIFVCGDSTEQLRQWEKRRAGGRLGRTPRRFF